MKLNKAWINIGTVIGILVIGYAILGLNLSNSIKIILGIIELLFIGYIIFPYLKLRMGSRLMTESECSKLMKKKMIERFGSEEYDIHEFDMVDTKANPELQRFRGWAPISGILWWIKAENPFGEIVEFFGDAKYKKDITHCSVANKWYETSLTEQLKGISVSMKIPKSLRYYMPGQKVKREESFKYEVK